MIKVEIRLKVASTRDREKFHHDELGSFPFENDYGVGTISLENPLFRLLLSTGVSLLSVDYLFGIETKNCKSQFEKLKNINYSTGGKVISGAIFEYPLGKVLH